MIKKTATAHWSGNLKEGKGQISTESGALKSAPYGFNARFEGGSATNPEELIGAAHAGCYTMALSAELGKAGFTPASIDTKAVVSLEKVGDGWEIPTVDLEVTASVPGIENDAFQQIAKATSQGCPVSKVLKAKINLTAKLA